MTYRTLVFFIFPIVVGLSVLSTTVVVGFAPSSSASSTTSFRGFTTTLRYASRAKNIKNKPRINMDPKDALLK